VSLFLCRRGGRFGAADVGKRPREPGQHLIKKFLKHKLSGRHTKTEERRRLVSKCVVLRLDLLFFSFLLFNAFVVSERWVTQMARTGGNESGSGDNISCPGMLHFDQQVSYNELHEF
jgi:hypothetical protein